MKNICLFFQIHHPFNFQTFRFMEIGESKNWYDEERNKHEIQEAVTNYYLPANNFLFKLIHQLKGKLKLSFYISGTSLDQFLMYEPRILSSFRQLGDTGQVEFTGGTLSHSIASLANNKDEFKRQIKQYQQRIVSYFGKQSSVLVNTDLLYSNQIGKIAAESGFTSILTNESKKMLQWRSPNYLYSSNNQEKINILFRNDGFSNRLSAMLSMPDSPEILIHLKEFTDTVQTISPEEPLIIMYLNYFHLGGSCQESKQQFFRTFVTKICKNKTHQFILPSDLSEHLCPVSEIGTDEPICWAENFPLAYYPGNELQNDARNQLFKLRQWVESTGNTSLLIDWLYLQTSDHFHLMDENHPAYTGNRVQQSIYKSKYDAFINYMNILEDFRHRLKAETLKQKPIHT